MGLLQFAGCALMTALCFPNMLFPNAFAQAGADQGTLRRWYVQGTTCYYWSLVVGQLAAAYCCTTFTQSLREYRFPNRQLNYMVAGEIVLALAIIYLPFMQLGIGTAELPLSTLVLPFFLVFLPIMCLEEVRKFYVRRWQSLSSSQRQWFGKRSQQLDARLQQDLWDHEDVFDPLMGNFKCPPQHYLPSDNGFDYPVEKNPLGDMWDDEAVVETEFRAPRLVPVV